jgi:hypothetical protein
MTSTGHSRMDPGLTQVWESVVCPAKRHVRSRGLSTAAAALVYKTRHKKSIIIKINLFDGLSEEPAMGCEPPGGDNRLACV